MKIEAEQIKKAAKDFEKKTEEWSKKVEKNWPQGKKGKTAEYIANIIVNIILIAIWGQLPRWLPFLTNSFTAILPLFNISFYAAIIVNFIFILNNDRFTVSLLKAILNVISIVVMISLYYIYPFDFSSYSENWNLIVKIAILVSIFGVLVGTIVEFAKTVSCKDK